MIENWYDESTAAGLVAAAGDDPAEQALALRVYTSRLIGQNPDLVMHGGGNTSVKVRRADLFGEVGDVLHVKGSGWDLDTIEAPGLPGLRLPPLLKLRALDALSDEDMVNVQRCNLLDSTSPNPSVETLLHAFLPHKFVDHTHATPFLILANLPNAAEVCREIFGDRLGIVPYIMPGFALAKKAAEVYEANPDVEGLLLLNHGHFAFGETARESYDKIVAHTNEAARWLGLETPTPLRQRVALDGPSPVPVLRGVIAEMRGDADAPMPVMDLRNGPEVMAFLDRPDLDDLAKRGVASPDHVIRIKGRPLVLPRRVWSAGRDAIRAAVAAWCDDPAVHVVVVTGGTGVTRRDVTPEAVEPLYDKPLPGFGELFRALSYDEIGAATIQSRASAGVARGTLVFLLPGSTNACRLAVERILLPQLDARTRPCNFARLLDRL